MFSDVQRLMRYVGRQFTAPLRRCSLLVVTGFVRFDADRVVRVMRRARGVLIGVLIGVFDVGL